MTTAARYEQGIHANVPMTDYVADRLRDEPTVSKGTLKALVEQSPAHAHLGHPRFGNQQDEGSDRADLGSIIHDVALGGEARVALIDADDFRTKAAREARDEARAHGKIPLLSRKWDDVRRVADRVKSALVLLGSFETEQTIIYRDGGVWCRSRPDAMQRGALVAEVKTVENADPQSWTRSTLCSQWYDVQAAHALAGLGIVDSAERHEYVWLLAEINPPFAVRQVWLDDALRDVADRRRGLGLKIWRKCLESNRWPDHGDKLSYAQPPTWVVWDLEAREMEAEQWL